MCVSVCGHETILKTSAPHSQRAGPDLLGLVAVQAVSGRATLAAAVAAAAAVAVC